MLLPYLTRVPLGLNMVLAKAGDRISEVCFPESSVIGFTDVLADGQQLAVAITGREGFIGWPLLLGNDHWPHEAVVRAESGTALKIEADAFLRIVGAHQGIREVLLRFTGTLVTQMSRTIVSNLIHPVETRTARWLLLYHDRITGDEIPLTHEELGAMLGCRRSSITDALAQLESVGAVRGLRGRVVIRDRTQLEALASATYGYAEAEYRRLLPVTQP